VSTEEISFFFFFSKFPEFHRGNWVGASFPGEYVEQPTASSSKNKSHFAIFRAKNSIFLIWTGFFHGEKKRKIQVRTILALRG
jgi:hypothetical protein